MNKLDVALKLLQLLNERKTIDSKTVARELNVSVRTAQRYLVELSILPCVATKQNEHSYSLNTDYRLHEALSNAAGRNELLPASHGPAGEAIAKSLCLICGGLRTPAARPAALATPGSSNLTRIDRLASIISRRLKNHKCSFP